MCLVHLRPCSAVWTILCPDRPCLPLLGCKPAIMSHAEGLLRTWNVPMQIVMATLALRRTKDTRVEGGKPVVELPPKHINEVKVTLSAGHREKYERWEQAGESRGRPSLPHLLCACCPHVLRPLSARPCLLEGGLCENVSGKCRLVKSQHRASVRSSEGKRGQGCCMQS